MAEFSRRALLLGSGAVVGGYLAAGFAPKNPVLEGTKSRVPKGAGQLR